MEGREHRSREYTDKKIKGNEEEETDASDFLETMKRAAKRKGNGGNKRRIKQEVRREMKAKEMIQRKGEIWGNETWGQRPEEEGFKEEIGKTEER